MPVHLAFSAETTLWSPNVSIPQTPQLASTAWAGAHPTTGLLAAFAQDQEIYGEGDRAETFMMIVSGVVRTCKFLDDGSRHIDAFYVQGDVFGCGDEPYYRLTAEAVSDCALISFRRRGLERLAANDSALAAQIFAYAMRRVVHAQDHALLLGRRCAVEKVTAFLREWGRHTPGERTITLAMSRRDIADYLGLTIESVSRALTRLRKDAVIELPSAREIRFKAQPRFAS